MSIVFKTGIISSCLLFIGCSAPQRPSDEDVTPKDQRVYSGMGKILGNDSLLFGRKKKQKSENSMGVNSFLWRASLDTISFAPLKSADALGGVIITDWYRPPEAPQERMKVIILILDDQLRADGLRISLFKQKRTPKGEWVEADVDPQSFEILEDAILKRARQLKGAKG